MPARGHRERGAALVVALLVVMVLSALGAGLVLIGTGESLVAGRFAVAREALAAADAALELTMADLDASPAWDAALQGGAHGSVYDGPPGVRTLADRSRLDLVQWLNVTNCGKASACTPAEMDAVSLDRPWGADNPRWQLFASGPLAAFAAGRADAPFHVACLVGDDPGESDGDPLHDGATAADPGAGVLLVRCEAFGARGVHRGVEATVRRNLDAAGGPAGPVRLASWRLIG